MMRKSIVRGLSLLAVLGPIGLFASPPSARAEVHRRKPNIVLILADDLGVGELGCYGQSKIKTPAIDRLATEGMRWTQWYAGANVCAPSRCSLLTGLHTGHTAIRTNGAGQFLKNDDTTLAEVLSNAGYETAAFGKYGLGNEGTAGHPNRQGFGEFFGYLDQVHAHFYYPYFLWHNETRYPLPENEGKRQGQYAHDLIFNKAIDFIKKPHERPFFLYWAPTIPHVELVVPEESARPYKGQFPESPLPDPRPGYLSSDTPYATFAGMVSRLDDQVGQLVATLKAQGLDEETILFFTSDNGPQGGAWKRLSDFFEGKGSLRGYKGDSYEGGIRVPLIARWPGQIKAGSISKHPSAAWDFMATLADLAGTKLNAPTDGISIVPTLLGKEEDQVAHDYLYWELTPLGHPLAQQCAIRVGNWKGVKPSPRKPWELYDLQADPEETRDLAAKEPNRIKELADKAESARTTPRRHPKPDQQPGIADFVR